MNVVIIGIIPMLPTRYVKKLTMVNGMSMLHFGGHNPEVACPPGTQVQPVKV